MYSRSKQNSQLNVNEYGQGQSRTNFYQSQSQQGGQFSPQKRKGQSRYGSNRKTQQVAGRIQDVIELCAADKNEGGNEFQEVANAERGILDMLLGSDLQEVNIPVVSGGFNHAYNQSGGLANGYGTNSVHMGPGGQYGKGSKPFLDINQQSPRQQGGPTSIRAHLNQNQRTILGDDAIEMIDEIERKAVLEIESLKRDKNDLIRRLNQQIRLHNNEKRRRGWCENELKRMIAFLQQQGVRVGPIQYPEWYFQQSVQPQQGMGQQTYVFGGQYGQTQNSGFGQPGHSRLVQTNTQGQQGTIQRPVSPGVEPNSPSFASQNQTQILDPSGGLYVQGQQMPIYQPGQQGYVQGNQYIPGSHPGQIYQQGGQSNVYQQGHQGLVYQPGQSGQGFIQGGQSNVSYPQQQIGVHGSPQANQFANPNQASHHTNVNQSAYNQMGQSVQRPQQVNSTYQIGGSNANIPPPGTGYQQGLDGSYYDPNANRTNQATVGGFVYNPQTGQYESGDSNYGGLRGQLEQLRQDNQNLRQNFQNIENPDDFAMLQQRLMAAEQRAKAYEREMERWKMEASRRGDYPGLAELLEQTERIRQQTIKLLRMKEKGALGGNRDPYGDEENYRPRTENYNNRSRKQTGKASFETGIYSPKGNAYQDMLEEMKRVTKG